MSSYDEQKKAFRQARANAVAAMSRAEREAEEVAWQQKAEEGRNGSQPTKEHQRRILDTTPTFPLEVFPIHLQRFVAEAAESLPCPVDYIAAPLLVMLGAAIGRSRVLEVKAGWCEGPRLWAAIVGDPGEIKTPALQLTARWAKERQDVDWKEFQEQSKDHKRAFIDYDVKLRRWKNMKAKNKLPIEEEADGPPAEPPPPIYRRTIVTDVTLEALAQILNENPRGVAVVSDELTGWFKGIGQYKKKGGPDKKHWLSIWSHQGLTVDRLTRSPVHVPHPFVSVTGSIQPGALKDLDPEEGMRDGFLHRILFVEPHPVPIRYTDTVIGEEDANDVGRLFSQLYALEGIPQHDDTVIPHVLKFTDDAKAEWISWYNQHCAEPQKDDFPNIVKGPWAKLRGYSVSLSLILALTEDPEVHEVSKRATLGAITLVDEYFKPHLRRLYPRILNREKTPFDLCRAAIMKALGQNPKTYKETRQSIGGRLKGELVRAVIDDLVDSETIANRPRPGARKGVTEYYLCENEQPENVSTVSL